MKALINAAVELCLLRLGPQHMPASMALFKLLLILNLLFGTLVVMTMRGDPALALLESLFELATLLLSLYLALNLAGRLARFRQTGNALLLSGLLIDLLALPPVTWYQRSHSELSGLLVLLLYVWSILVLGHIIRHAFSVDFTVGLAAGLLYAIASWNLTALLFPVTA